MRVVFKLTVFAILFSLFSFTSTFAQQSRLSDNFRSYEIATFDSKALKAYSQKRSNDFIRIPFVLSEKWKWNLELTTKEVFADRFVLRKGAKSRSRTEANLPIVLKGYDITTNRTRATITVNDNFLYGSVETGEDVIYFEPLSTFDKSAAANEIVIYKESDVIANDFGTCAATSIAREKDKLSFGNIKEDKSNNRSAGPCLEVELAIANEFNVSQARANVTSWNAGVIANVNTDYDDGGFDNPIQFVIVETYISTGSASGTNQNEWGSSADSETLLDNFSAWAPSANGFNNTHDLGELWTETNITYKGNASVIGLAWIGVVCEGYRYHILEDFTNNASQTRALVSHEIGHNFNLDHSGDAGVIMNGTISAEGSTIWGPFSTGEMNSYLGGGSLGCLGTCDGGGGNPPVANFNGNILQECPAEIRFNDLSSNTPTAWSWQFENGSPSSSTLQSPIITFPGSGAYGVTLTATNNDGSDTQIQTMNLTDLGNTPDAQFTFSVSGNTVSFNNNTAGSNAYSWDFGDGGTSTSENPSHTYASFGSYTVVLTATNNCGSDSETKTIAINDQVTAAFTANTTQICEGGSISYTNQSSANATSYLWAFENGTPSTSTLENPTVTYNNAGTYNVRLTASSAGGSDIENKVNFVNISPAPNASFTEEIIGYSVAFTNATSNGNSYSWSFGDGNRSTSTSPTHIYTTPGTYSVTLTSSNSCGTDNFAKNIVIADPISASFEVDKTSGCTDDTYLFTSTSTGEIESYFWEFENGVPATSSDPNPSVTFPKSGQVDISLTIFNSFSTDNEYKVNLINIVDSPSADFNFLVDEYTVDFENESENGSTFTWLFGDGNSSTSVNATHTFTDPGDYQVTLTASNSCGEDVRVRTVTIESKITAEFSASVKEVCEGESVQFTNLSEGTITSYFWEFQGASPATSTEENPTVTYNTVGEFNAILTVSDGTLQDSETKTSLISVGGTPVAGFSYETDKYEVSFTNNSLDANSFLWDFGGGASSTEINPSHTFDTPGTYEVDLQATNNCDVATSSQSILITEFVLANFTTSATEICVGETIAFASASEGEIASLLWEFPGGSPATSSAENPEVVYNSPGVYDVKLTITGEYGAEDSKTLTEIVVVQKDPEANFTYIIDENTVAFTNTSTDFNSVTWHFGDGVTSTELNPAHTYAEEGNYTVSLQVDNDCATIGKELVIAVFDELLANFQASETDICPGQEVVLQDLSAGNPTEWEWEIMGEETLFAVEQNPVISFTLPGTYAVELTVRNLEEEDTKLLAQYIDVKPLPEVGFVVKQNELIVEFENSSQNGISYLWDFGDGNTSKKANPTHEYAQEGNYTISLKVENSCSVIESIKEINVQTQLIAEFGAATTEICETSTIQFNNLSSVNADSWKWEFPGGIPASSTTQNPEVSYSTAGQYDVVLVVERDGVELRETKSSYVKVGKLPTAGFSFEVDKNEVQFINKSENADSYYWSFGSDEENPTFSFDEEKEYEVTLITTNSCTTEKSTQLVDLYAEAETYANFSISSDSYCKGDELAFLDLSSGDVTEWKWNFPGATPSESTEENPTVKYDSLGNYDVQLTVTNGFNTRTFKLSEYITIVESPSAGFEISQTANKIIVNNQAINAAETEWYIDAQKQDAPLKDHTFAENGTYQIKQIVRNSCGESEIVRDVEIDVFPSAGFSLDISRGCAPLTVNYESRATDNADDIIWLLEGLDTIEVSGFAPSVVYEIPGNYGIKVIASNAYGSDTIELGNLIEVLAEPVADFTYQAVGFEANFIVTSASYDYVQWDLGDGTTSNTETFLHEYQGFATSYMVQLEVFTGDCSDIIVKEVELLSTGTDELSDLSQIKLYPNPTSSHVTVDFKGITDVVGIDLVDHLGRRLVHQDIAQGAETVSIQDLLNIPAGQYFISLHRDGSQSIHKKLLIIR